MGTDDWIDFRENPPGEENYGRYFVIKVNCIPHLAVWRQPQWDSGWNIPKEWSRPTHYYPLPDDCKFEYAVMD